MSEELDPAELVARARMAAAMGDIHGLRVTLMEVAFEHPALVMLVQALVLLDQGRHAAAAAILEAIDGLSPALDRLTQVAHAQALIGLGQPEQAVSDLQAVLSDRAEAEPDLLATLARAFFQSGELQLAEALLEAVLGVVPRHFDARYGMGVVQLMKGEPLAGLADLRRAQRVNPRRRETYQAIARAWRLIGRPAEGAAELEALMGGNELVASPGLASELVELYAAIGDDAQRARWVRYLEANAELGPGHRIELGRHWLAMAQPGALRRLLVGLRDEGDDQVAGWLLAGMAEQLDGATEQALAYYQTAARARPSLWLAQERTARLLLDAAVPPAYAAPFVQAAEAAAPQTPEVRLVRALCDLAQGRAEARHALIALAHHRGVRAEVRTRADEALRQA